MIKMNMVLIFRKLAVFIPLFSLLVGVSGCGGGGGRPQQPAQISSVQIVSSSAAASSSSQNSVAGSVVAQSSSSAGGSSSNQSAVAQVTLQGTVTFGLVKPVTNGRQVYLDYGNATSEPSRGVTVELLDSLSNILATTATDDNGLYSFSVAANKSVKVRVKAQLSSENYVVTVKDNTQNNAMYVLNGTLAGSGSSAVQTRDLHAKLGWNSGTNSYATERQSAPFAIIDSLYNSLSLVVAANSAIELPPLDVFWSKDNIAINGSFSSGEIGSSIYSPGESAIFLLGKENDDTDEFDNTVVQHEFGHFLEDKLSRSESIGGNHTLGVPVDMRVAFGEGFGNAFAAMSSGQSFYIDTSSNRQQRGFSFDVETNAYGGGYYSESAVQSVLYDIFDTTNEAGDEVSLGFTPILAALMHDDYITFDGFTSIFLFADILKTIEPASSASITALLQSQNIFGKDKYGTDETSTGSVSFSLPVYQRIGPNQTVEVCSDNNIQEYNGVETRRFILLDVPATGNYTISAQRTRGIQPSDPDLRMYRQGTWAGLSEGPDANLESWTKSLSQSVYALSVYEALNVDEDDITGGLVCFNVTFSTTNN